MAKLKDCPISAEDLAEFARDDSNFAFEMQVLAQLLTSGFSCVHSGTYRDPVTSKMRQFDIRASMDRNRGTLALAVECKNLRPNSPLLLSTVPRTDAEAFHDLILMEANISTVRPVTGRASAYLPWSPVGKKSDQVGRLEQSGELVSDDAATFDKVNQAVSSCRDLVEKSFLKVTPPEGRVIVPVLVLPTGLLWQVDYSLLGEMTSPPRQVNRATLYLDHVWLGPERAGPFGAAQSYRLSHLEVLTLEGLKGIAEWGFGWTGLFQTLGR